MLKCLGCAWLYFVLSGAGVSKPPARRVAGHGLPWAYETRPLCYLHVYPPLFCFRVVLLRVQSNIVLSGGSTLLAGLPDRIEADVRSHAPADVEINVMAAQERALFVFIGGSILASLPTFESQWISSEVGACVGWQFVVLICLLLSLINVRCCRRGCF